MSLAPSSYKPRAISTWKSGSMLFSHKSSLWRRIEPCRGIYRTLEPKSTRWQWQISAKCVTLPSSIWSSLQRSSRSSSTSSTMPLSWSSYLTSPVTCSSLSVRSISSTLCKKLVRLWRNWRDSRVRQRRIFRCVGPLSTTIYHRAAYP